MSWEAVIGLEIHVQLATRSKIFSGASTGYGAEPNTQACAVDLGLPGVLPVLNGAAVRMAVLFGLAIDAQIAPRAVFARKNYFYPDLPKGYQISQYELPIVHGGHVNIVTDDGAARRVGVTRAHLEEDAGKSLHEGFGGPTGIDLNRAGMPLIEIVSEPDMSSAAQAVAYMKKIHTLVRYLDVSDGNMQEGSFRCDANVSVRRRGADALGTRTETKNLNSFRFVGQAIEYEIARQIEVLESGGEIVQETRLYDPDRGETRTMRVKEEANDYRYFPDPDLLPVELSAAEIEEIRAQLPELPDARAARIKDSFGLAPAEAGAIASDRILADYFETVVEAAGEGSAKTCAHWVSGDLAAALHRENRSIDDCPVAPRELGMLVRRIEDETISGRIAKDVFEAMWRGEGGADEIIVTRGLKQVTDSGAIEALVDQVLAENPDQADQFRAGKTKVLGFLVGQVMKMSGGKANPKQVNELLRTKLVE
jgi:aspartyl-tRNA(Asn)/glutamyl-tRNA(Gln) amidotransferase subunit B